MKTHLLLLITAIATGVLLSPKAALGQAPSSRAPATMKAIVYHEFGSPDVLRLEEVDKPVPKDNEILVKVRAASVNPYDWHFIRGTPYLMRLGLGLLKPRITRLGVDFAGTIEAVGKDVKQFKPGDEVFGGNAGAGAFAEYISVTEKDVALKPANITFEQAGSVAIAGLTALQAVRDKAKAQPGQKILINGASGGVGTFAVQIAKSFGANVTGVCSTRNVDLVRSLGADHVIDYTKEDFTKSQERYDVIVDNVGNQPLLSLRRALTPKGKYIIIGGGGLADQGLIGPMFHPIKAILLSPFVSQEMGMQLTIPTQNDYKMIADLMQAGKVIPVIDRTYPLSQLPAALRYLEEGHARGKVALTVGDNIDPLAPSPNRTAASAGLPSPGFIAFELIGIPLGVLIFPIFAALALNRRWQQRNPGKRGYRWGYYFGIVSVAGGLLLGAFLGFGATSVILCVLLYGLLALSFARRCHWAWITLTILSFNPVVWIINTIYLWKRWSEEPQQCERTDCAMLTWNLCKAPAGADPRFH